MTSQKNNCPLCCSESESFYNEQFRKCPGCKSIFRVPDFFISPEKEKLRYEEHNNDIEDTRYQKFVGPIVDEILEYYSPHEIWLDFWAGTGPVISHLLEKKWFHIRLYDPFFHNSPEFLTQTYDFIIVCEVVEHFHNPKKEFELLYNLLKPGGRLYIMTDLYTPDINFKQWYYKNDKTHVFFYSDQAFELIAQNWAYKKYTREGRCIILKK